MELDTVLERATDSSTYDPVAVARSLRPVLVENAADCEAQGRMTPAVLAKLKETGLFMMLAPTSAGGRAATARQHIDTVCEIATVCPSTAWAFGILSSVTGMARSFPNLRDKLFQGDELCCFVGAPTGRAEPVDGGYRVNGEWRYASGCLQARWALCTVRIEEGVRWAFIDLHCSDSVEIVLDWNVAGLSGTGSNMVRAVDHFVPAEIVLDQFQSIDIDSEDRPKGLEARYYWPSEPQSPLIVFGSMIGAAEGLLATVKSRMGERPVVNWDYPRQADSEQLVAMLGEAAMKIESARMHTHRVCDLLDVTAQQRSVTRLEKVRAQADLGYAARLLGEASQMLMNIAGPAAFATDNRAQRFWRDINVGIRHNSVNSALSLELYGRSLVGEKSNYPLLP